MTTKSISVFRKEVFNTVDKVIEYNDVVTINTKKGNAIIISEDEYNSLIETVYLISQPEVLKKIKAGEQEDIDSMETYNPNEEW